MSVLHEKPPVWGRVMAVLRGEIPADALEAYYRGGTTVFALLAQGQEAREARRAAGVTPWTSPPAVQAELLCVWNAMVLQTLGDRYLEADYEDSPSTIGYVPRVTAAQALACYGQVEGWLSRASQAQLDEAYRLDVALPAELPAWGEVEPCPRPHLAALSTWDSGGAAGCLCDTRRMKEMRTPDYTGYRFPPAIIGYTVWRYCRFALSYRDVEELLAERGVVLTYETVRRWCRKFGSDDLLVKPV